MQDYSNNQACNALLFRLYFYCPLWDMVRFTLHLKYMINHKHLPSPKRVYLAKLKKGYPPSDTRSCTLNQGLAFG